MKVSGLAVLAATGVLLAACGTTAGELASPDPSPTAPSDSPSSSPTDQPTASPSPSSSLDATPSPSSDPAGFLNIRGVQVDLLTYVPIDAQSRSSNAPAASFSLGESGSRSLWSGEGPCADITGWICDSEVGVVIDWNHPGKDPQAGGSPQWSIKNQTIGEPFVDVVNTANCSNTNMSEGQVLACPQDRSSGQFKGEYWWIKRHADDSCGEFRKCFEMILGYPPSPTLTMAELQDQAPKPVPGPDQFSTRNVKVTFTTTVPVRYESFGTGRGFFSGSLGSGDSAAVSSNDQSTQSACFRWGPADDPQWDAPIESKLAKLCAHNPDVGYPSIIPSHISNDFFNGSNQFFEGETKYMYLGKAGYDGMKISATRNPDDSCGDFLKCFTFSYAPGSPGEDQRVNRWYVAR